MQNDAKKSFESKRGFNANRECYISSDGKYLCYIAPNVHNSNRQITHRIRIDEILHKF